MEIYNYNGIALTPYREGTNCGGHIEGKESCIHLKFGGCTKYADFTEDFKKKHKVFYERYDALGENPKLEQDRNYMLSIGREIINLKEQGELVVICNMCDCECPNAESVAFYAIQQSKFNFTGQELTKE